MKLTHTLKDSLKAAKELVLGNLDKVTEKTGTENPYGDKTLLLDEQAENEIIRVLRESNHAFSILTEENGFIPHEAPEFLAIIDPIDGSANLERSLPLVSAGISAIPYKAQMTTEDIQVSVIDSFFTNETYVAVTGKGVTLNSRNVSPSKPIVIEKAIISYDTKRSLEGEFGESSLRALRAVHDMRRTASNLLDLCWTACGALDGMVDLRGLLPIVHVCGTHMVLEAGGYVVEENGSKFCLSIDPDVRMSFVAANNEILARSILAAFKG